MPWDNPAPKSGSKIKSIETVWHGHRFRSRLEARWAVVFECMGIDWEYEPEGFEFEDGTRYLPDFLLHGIVGRNGYDPKREGSVDGDVYVEVKGHWTDKDRDKVARFAEHRPIYCVGNVPSCFSDMDYDDDTPNFNFETIDGDFFGAYINVRHDGECELAGADSNYMGNVWHDVTNLAFKTASMARFEHGEQPDQNAIDRCRRVINAAKDARAKTIEVYDRLLDSFTGEEIVELNAIVAKLQDIKERHELTNIWVEAYNDSQRDAYITASSAEIIHPYACMRIFSGYDGGELSKVSATESMKRHFPQQKQCREYAKELTVFWDYM